ncbi:DUF3231 family protein [Clostridium sp.]|uniref:DUF3231 family protein n=1 Tax=Clostridium sp. TaxID=1506 RepID=UPI00261BA11D|nr:DUF3231 family protein [uncultured Clostridium sp.]
MTTEAKIQLTSSEIGTLWMTYLLTSSRLIAYDYFKIKTIDKEAQNILSSYITEVQNDKNKIVDIFKNEGAVIPIGFNEHDEMKESSTLYDDFFHISSLREAMKLSLGRSAVYITTSYMKEVNDVFKLTYDISNKYYMITTNYLLGKGVLSRSPYVTMPKQVTFIEDNNYMSGINPLSDKRSLNTIEVGFINEAIEANIWAMHLLTGFVQVLKGEVKKYLTEGKELTKKIISELSAVLLQSDIQPPSTWAGKVTDSIQPPFSEKLMMYLNSLIATTALGTSFSMRKDLPLKLGIISKDIFKYSKKRSKIMIKYKWLEEPPQMEDRNQITK